MQPFQSEENLAFLENICDRFLSDSLNVKLPTQELKDCITNHVYKISSMPDAFNLSLDDLNKRVIISVKRSVLQPQEADVVIDRPTQGDPERDSESKFMAKLELLEKSRNTLTKVAAAKPQQSQPVPQPLPQPVTLPSQPVPSQPLQLPQPVPQPLPLSPSKAIVVHGHERDYIYHSGRSTFLWTGQLPKGLESSMIRLTSAVIPNSKETRLPYITLTIEGAGGRLETILLDHKGRPFSQGLGTMRLMACPWTVSIKTSDGRELPLGNDTFQIKSVEQNCIYSDFGYNFAGIGDCIRLGPPGSTVIVVEGIAPGRILCGSVMTETLMNAVGKYMINLTRQVTLIFESI